MRIDIQQAIQFPFSVKGWEKKLGILLLVMLVVMIVNSIVNVVFQLPLEIFGDLNTQARLSSESQSIFLLFGLLSAGVQMFVSILLIPFQLYIHGYTFEYVKDIKNRSELALRDHGEIKERIRLGFIRFLLSLPSMLIAIVPIVLLVVAISITVVSLNPNAPQYSPNSEIYALTTLYITSIGVMVIFLVLTYFINNAIFYLYLSNYGFWQSLNPKNILKVLKIGLKDLFILGLVKFGISILVAIVGLILICFSFFTFPILAVMLPLVFAHLDGQAYRNIDIKMNEKRNG